MESKARVRKRPLDRGEDSDYKVYKFKVLLPNGISVMVTLRNPKSDIGFEEFIELVRDEYNVVRRNSMKQKRNINWKSEELYLKDTNDRKLTSRISLGNFKPHKCHILWLHDGSSGNPTMFENMWDLTPDTDLLTELPEDYTSETALADLIDNSLQAVWFNGQNERRLIRVNICDDKISIFDSGPGMDNSEEKSIAMWGKLGSSLHRQSKELAIGGDPPYLKPVFGMFGYGGAMASMHLGRHASVCSKTKESKKVWCLLLEREALLSHAGSEQTWRSTGGVRDPHKDEVEGSPHGSFTKVVISKLKQRSLDVCKLQCMLKDIYFPYIQCDEFSKTGKISTPVEFQVNGLNLTEVHGGEIATTNMHSCNGNGFTLQLHFSIRGEGLSLDKGSRTSEKANARLKCIYFPIVKGKESIEEILKILDAKNYGNSETFESFSHVSIRRLGRLLPDARWGLLPFMDLRQKKGDNKVHLLKKCCMRVKCFIDTDAGFKPTPYKTDLMQRNLFTNALKSLGSRSQEKGDVDVKIFRDGKILTHAQLEKEYQVWLMKMHEDNDEEIEAGEDNPIIVVLPTIKKELGVLSNVLRVHQIIKKGNTLWKRDQKIKVLKGACQGCYDKNLFATLEYFLLEGFQGETGGGARIMCRPIGLEEEKGCSLQEKDGTVCLDARESLSLPISVIDSGKCVAISTDEWESKLIQLQQKNPGFIDLLNGKQCEELDFQALPSEKVYAGFIPPTEIVAVIRPASFVSSSASMSLEQKHIVKDKLTMSLKLTFTDGGKEKDVKHIYSSSKGPSSHKGLYGLYIFQLEKVQNLFQKAGVYTFVFSCENSSCKKCEEKVVIVGSPTAASWKLLGNKLNQLSARVGFSIPHLSVACYDDYHNQIPFLLKQDLKIKLTGSEVLLYDGTYRNARLSSDRLILKIEDAKVETKKLDLIRPDYAATLVICSQDQKLSVSVPCQVHPGSLDHVRVLSPLDQNQLLPGSVVQELKLEMFDAYNNHLEQGSEIEFNVNGFSIQGQRQKVDQSGCIDLGGLLRVTAGYGKSVSLSVLDEGKQILKQEFTTVKRELQLATQVPKQCVAGSKLEGVTFKVVDPEGDVDETIHNNEKCDQHHTLYINSESLSKEDPVRYAFNSGYCVIPIIHLPQTEGPFKFIAQHSRFTELKLMIEVSLMCSPKEEPHEFHSPCPDGKFMLLDYSPSTTSQRSLVPLNVEKMCWDDLNKYAQRNGTFESERERIEKMVVTKEQEILELEDSLEREANFSHGQRYLLMKEDMMKEMDCRSDSAAAVLYLPPEVSVKEPQEHFMQDVIGVVAFLGTVGCPRLSKVLAEYLGEDQMLAVVCKSSTAALALEKYDEHGEVDGTHGIHALAEACGRCIKGRFHVFCLEDIRPYGGKLEGTGVCKKLALPDPMLKDGSLVPDFLGYAVNMINPDCKNGSLRKTLFYRLLGKLQVYRTRDGLEAARHCNCISDAAVSLDGGIVRENGVISLGSGAPKISFPVDMHLSAQGEEILSRIKTSRDELTLIKCKLEMLKNASELNLKKYNRRKRKLEGMMDRQKICAQLSFGTQSSPHTPTM